MNAASPQEINKQLSSMLQPWHAAIENPAASQETVLENLLKIYAQTEYGKQHAAENIASLDDYRKTFPVMTYEDYKPLIKRVMNGDINLLLNEDPLGWAITRGTTKGESKFIPMTPTDIQMRVSAGRAMLNYVATTKRFDLFQGVNLNLNFPSTIGSLTLGDRQIEYGYSSGIYTRFVSTRTPIRSVPSQEQINALGGSKTLKAWGARFELAYDLCKSENVTLVGGVATTAIEFARFLKKQHNCYPKQLWQTQIMTLGSVAGINTRLQPTLNALYGNQAVIREIYGTTEGMFGQQMDQKRAWTPNYDLFFFEIETRKGIKQLHQMKPGETGSLIVSTPVLPRYKIGDIIRAFKAPYFRCIGRQQWWTPLHYIWGELLTLNLNRL